MNLLFVFAAFSLCNCGIIDATIVFDPWVIADREAISSALLSCTHIPAVFGENNLGNILWGLDIQTRWQITSGRQQSKSSARIDEYAWFANINYLLTIVPYLAAMKSDLLPATQFLPSQFNSPSKYPVLYEEIDKELARGWTYYFETVKQLQVDPTYVSLESLQRILWVVHNSTVVKALPEFNSEIQLLNRQEKKFANGFGHFVEILAIMNVNTSYPSIYSLNQMFPQRLLNLLDVPPLILNMSPQQNVIISTFFSINDMTDVPLVWTLFVETLRNGMADVNCSVKLLQNFNDFLSAPITGLIESLTNVLNLLC